MEVLVSSKDKERTGKKRFVLKLLHQCPKNGKQATSPTPTTSPPRRKANKKASTIHFLPSNSVLFVSSFACPAGRLWLAFLLLLLQVVWCAERIPPFTCLAFNLKALLACPQLTIFSHTHVHKKQKEKENDKP